MTVAMSVCKHTCLMPAAVTYSLSFGETYLEYISVRTTCTAKFRSDNYSDISSHPIPLPTSPPSLKMQLSSLTSLAPLAHGARAGTIHKRNGEGVHLANCYQNSPLGQIPFSQFLYYADDAQATKMLFPLALTSVASRTRDKSAGRRGKAPPSPARFHPTRSLHL